MQSKTIFLVLIIFSIILLAFFLSSATCEPFWEKYVVSTRGGESGDSVCFNWCIEEKGVKTSSFNFSGKDEYGFSSYECYCDLRDCGNFLKIFR